MARFDFEKSRYHEPSQRRLYPISTFNSACARPLSWLLAGLGFTPNLVSLLSLAVSVLGLVLVADGSWARMTQGALLVHLGLLLDHADGQVARRKGLGTTWGMYLDMVIDRIVEIGLVLGLAFAAVRGVTGVPAWLPPVWAPLGLPGFLVLAVATVGAMMAWRFLTAYNDLLYLRTHLLSTKRVPGPTVIPKRLVRRPLVPWVFNRDWVFLMWLVGVLLAQIQALLFLLLGLHLLVSLEKVVVFAVRHKDPEGDATRVLGRDYH